MAFLAVSCTDRTSTRVPVATVRETAPVSVNSPDVEEQSTTSTRNPAVVTGNAGATPAKNEQSATTSKPVSLERQRDALNTPAQSASAKTLPTTRNDRLISLASLVPSYPQDFEIGVLHDKTMSTDSSAMVRVSDQFFLEISNGALTKNTVHSQWIEHVTRSLRPQLEARAEVDSVRYGAPRLTGDTAGSIPLRVFRGNGRAVGSIVLELDGNRWYIADLHVNLRTIDIPVPSRDTLFDPTSNRR